MRLLLLLLLLPFASSAQHFSRLSRVVVGGTGSGGGVAVDTSHEALVYSQVMNVQYNPLRPNKRVVLGGDCSFFMNGVPVSSSGDVRFIFVTGSENLQVNGVQNTSPPGVPGLFQETYGNVAGLMEWN